MATDEGFTIENEYFRIVHPKTTTLLPLETFETNGEPTNIIDGNNDTYFEIFDAVATDTKSKFTIYPKFPAVRYIYFNTIMEGVAVGGLAWTSLSYEDSNGHITQLIKESDRRAQIDRVTFPINKRIREINLEFEAVLAGVRFRIFEFDMRCMSPSRLYGKNRTETVQFAEYCNTFNSGLQYKRNSNTVKNIYLVQPGDPLDSNFRIKLQNGSVMALAKYP